MNAGLNGGDERNIWRRGDDGEIKGRGFIAGPVVKGERVVAFGQVRESPLGRIFAARRDLGQGGDRGSRVGVLEIDLENAGRNWMVHIAARVALALRKTAGVYGVEKNCASGKSSVLDDAALRVVLMKLNRRRNIGDLGYAELIV